MKLPDECCFNRGPPCDLLNVGITGDDSITAGNLCDRDDLTINLHLLP